jgi:hypothetical protein
VEEATADIPVVPPKPVKKSLVVDKNEAAGVTTEVQTE